MRPHPAFFRRLLLSGLFGVSLALAGCGAGITTTETVGTLAMSGRVHGGVQPITGATIQLFAVGSGGNGTAAVSLLRNPVTTDGHSYFSITGDYSCPSASSQVYLVARGGNPGFTGNVNNQALVLMSALGNCGNLINNPSRFISVNEVSTVAAVYALAPFMTSYDHVAGSATNTVGLQNAFLNAQLLADPATGMAPQLPSNLTVESRKLYALADAIVPCVNSTGSNTACGPLFTAATVNGTAPTDVVGALLNIVEHPGNNVAAVFNVIGSTPPYPNPLTTAPHDWTMSLTVTGGGMNNPTSLAIDVYGNAWVTNYGTSPADSGLIAFTPQGTPFPGSPFGVGVQTESYGLALDKNSDIWVISKEGNSAGGGTGSVAKFFGASSGKQGMLDNIYADGTLYFPQSIATDPSGNGTVIIGNYSGHNYTGGSATIYDLNGTYVNNLGNGIPNFPVGVSSDAAGGVWFANQGNQTIAHAIVDPKNPSNPTVQVVNCCNGAQTVSLDLLGNVWVTNFSAVGFSFTFSEVSPSGAVLINRKALAQLSSPGGSAVDAAGQFWLSNYNGASITEIAGNSLTGVTAGTALSPAGYGQDAGLHNPFSLTVDQSGNVWVANEAANSLTMFFGLATPTAKPATPRPVAP